MVDLKSKQGNNFWTDTSTIPKHLDVALLHVAIQTGSLATSKREPYLCELWMPNAHNTAKKILVQV
jgi:hypothetical protein